MSKICFSKKITVLSFFLSVMIVYIHSLWKVSNQTLVFIHTYFFNLQNVCVPMFFFISGYLFFRNFSMEKLYYKYKKRAKTLLIPYLIWNVISFFYSYIIMKFFGANVEIPSAPLSVLFSILNAEYSVLWFVKHLMIYTIIAPIIYFVLKNKKIGAISLVFLLILLWYTIKTQLLILPINLTSNCIWIYLYEGIYYLLGSYFALNWKKEFESMNLKRAKISAIFILVLLILNLFTQLCDVPVIILVIYRLLFCCLLFFTLDLLPDIDVKWWMKISFFIYCAHMYPLQLCQQLIIKINSQDIVALLNYIIVPIFTIILCLIVAKKLINKYVRIWNIITGERGC